MGVPFSRGSPGHVTSRSPRTTRGCTDTRVPGATPAPGPAASTVPASSCPIVTGRCGTMN